MADSVHVYPLEDEDLDLSHHASFVLRCWMGKGKEVRARLIDARSGISYPLTDLVELPALVHRLVTETLPTESPADAKRS